MYILCKKSVEDPMHFTIHCKKYKDYRGLFGKNMTNQKMKIERNYPNKTIQLFKVNADLLRHCLIFFKDIHALRSEV